MTLDLLAEYPLVPAYPGRGPHHILVHWSHDEQNEVIVARTEKALLRILRALMEQDEWKAPEKIRWYYKGHVIDPPARACQEWAERTYTGELCNFKYWIDVEVDTFKEAHGKLPAVFDPCPVYEKPEPQWEEDEEDEDDEDAAWMRKNDAEKHYDCENCDGRKIIPVAPWTWDTIFEQLRDDFRASQPYFKTWPTGRPVTASDDVNEDRVFAAVLNGGDHRSGVEIQPFDWFMDRRRLTGNLPVLFFFEGEELDHPESVTNLLAEIEAEREAEKARGKIEGEARWQAKERAKQERATKLFAKLDTLELFK